MSAEKERLKVLFFTSSLRWGGITRVILNLLKRINPQRFTPALAVYAPEENTNGELLPGIRVYPLLQREGRGTQFFKLFWSYRRVLGGIDPDVVIVSAWKPHLISLLVHTVDLSKRRKLILREDIAFSPYFRDTHGPGMKGRISPVLTRFFYSRADRIVACSQGIKNESIDYGIPEHKISVIHNPVDLESIDQLKRQGIENHKPFILFVGRLCKQKNLPLLIHAFHLIKDRWNIDLLMLGDGEEEAPLKALVKTLGMEDRVFFKGYIMNPYPYMGQARILALSSDYEGFPCVLLEAMACGVPPVSTDCPHGPREIIQDRRNGLLVPVGNAPKFAEALDRMLKDDALREAFIAQGYKDIQSYELGAIARRYEALIMDVWSNP